MMTRTEEDRCGSEGETLVNASGKKKKWSTSQV
jgi:hypothetical protein